MDQPPFMCWHCSEKCTSFTSVINHTITFHYSKELKYRYLKLDQKSGKAVYATKKFQRSIIPSEIYKQGCKIHVSEDQKLIIEEKKKTDSTTCTATEKSQSDKEVLAQTDISKSEEITRLENLAPAVAECMKSEGHLHTWLTFHEMIKDKTFPMDNICFKLFMDVVRFLGNSNTSSMRYSKEVKSFWTAGFRLFRGRFLRFMGGQKSGGQLVDGCSMKTLRLLFFSFCVQCLRDGGYM